MFAYIQGPDNHMSLEPLSRTGLHPLVLIWRHQNLIPLPYNSHQEGC
uniref:Uncharacterized protein n=1 Tax=Arundo donax TaxID=35708 RepID=A0A0A9FTE8_ARUDO